MCDTWEIGDFQLMMKACQHIQFLNFSIFKCLSGVRTINTIQILYLDSQ